MKVFKRNWGLKKQWPRLYSWTMPQELIYCRAVWRGAAAPLEAEQFHTPGTALCQTAWATWPREWPLCPWQRFLRCLPTQVYLWFHNSGAGVWTGQKYGSRRSSGMQGWQKPRVALPFVGTTWIQAGTLIWWRGLVLAKLLNSSCHTPVKEKEKGVWTCRRANRSRDNCVTSVVTAASSANCYWLSGNFVRPGCQLKFSHKNVCFS